jgi:hypothetical protein
MAIADVLAYLEAALDLPLDRARVYEIGGADQVSYGGLMREYARQRGLHRLMIPVPVLTPWLSSLWLGLVTPLYARVGRILIESIRHPTIVRDHTAQDAFPAVRPLGVREAMAAALRALPYDHVDTRTVTVPVPPETAFRPIQRIGGRTGWYALHWLWHVRGAIDVVLGGVGMRRGRRDPDALQVGDTIDCWRVEAYAPNRLLRLAAEMRLPGRAWLEFAITGDGHTSMIRQTATFDPRGVLGRARVLVAALPCALCDLSPHAPRHCPSCC